MGIRLQNYCVLEESGRRASETEMEYMECGWRGRVVTRTHRHTDRHKGEFSLFVLSFSPLLQPLSSCFLCVSRCPNWFSGDFSPFRGYVDDGRQLFEHWLLCRVCCASDGLVDSCTDPKVHVNVSWLDKQLWSRTNLSVKVM